MRNIKKSVAFTLTEILIVIGIIGIISALAIPNLNKSVSNQEKVTKLKKIYAELNQAHNAAVIKYGPLNTWFTNDNCESGYDCLAAKNRYFDRITEFMKLQKNCETTLRGCMPEIAKELNDRDYGSIDTDIEPRVILAGGWSFGVHNFYDKRTSSTYTGYKTNGDGAQIFVDIDGPNKGKNTYGIDLFSFIVTTDGIYPRGGGGYWNDDKMKVYCFYYGTDCAAWIINTGNMDYIDASRGNNSGEGSGICKNGHQLTIAEPSCR